MAYVQIEIGVAIVALFAVAVMAILVGYGSSRLRVADGALHVGRHMIEGHWIACAEPFDGASAAATAGPGANPKDFLHTRPYIAGLVRVTLDDPADPHPHWLVSTRSPEPLAEAINGIAKDPA